MKKKVTGIGVALFLISVVLLGCGSGEETGGSSDAEETEVIGSDAEDATSLTFWTFQGLHIDLFEDAVYTWNEENPNQQIQLTAEAYPYDQMHNNLLMALQSGTGAPDIVDIEISRFSNYLEGDIQLLELERIIEPVKDSIVESRLDIYGKDGGYYGIPTHVGATVMFYNMEIMDEAGVDPSDIVTRDDYVEAGEQVVAATGKPMTTIETEDHINYWALISQQGSDYFDEDWNVTVDNQINIDTLQFLYDMIYEYEIAEVTPGGGHHAEEYYGFMNQGGAASVQMPLWYMGRFLEFMPDLEGKIEIHPLPSWEPGGFRSAGMGGTGTVVTNQTEEPELAMDFLAHAKLSEEANIKLWEVLGFDPPRFDTWDDPRVLEDNEYYQFFGDNIFDVLHDIREEIHPVNITPDTPEMAQFIDTNVLHNVLREQSQTPEEALQAAADELR